MKRIKEVGQSLAATIEHRGIYCEVCGECGPQESNHILYGLNTCDACYVESTGNPKYETDEQKKIKADCIELANDIKDDAKLLADDIILLTKNDISGSTAYIGFLRDKLYRLECLARKID